ncbi:MAG: hypothetical protein ACRD0K_28305 [Egibacteraceae bacterium]
MQQQFEHSSDAAESGDSARQVEHTASRRGFLGWMGRLGIAVVGGVAGLTTLGRPAAAEVTGPGCCNLAVSTKCENEGPNYKCPDGYQKQLWYCTSGGTTYGCGECTTGPNCRSGDYVCSVGWIEG